MVDPSNPLLIITSCFTILIAVLYPLLLSDLIWVNYGFRRQLQPISDFPYQCRRINGPGLQACEDMWLSEQSRQLFLACSNSLSRKEWMPNIGRLNDSGRSLEDKLIALDLDKPVGTGFEYRVLDTSDFPGINGDGKLHLVGLTGVDRENHVELYFVNNRPSIDTATGKIVDNKKTGANTTIEHFRVNPQAEEVQFVKTYADWQIATPNNIATTGDGSFYFTNDHGHNKVGIGHKLSPILKDGDISFCNEEGCKRVEVGHAFPNGLAFDKDGLLYVPSTFSGSLQVYKIQDDNEIKKVATVKIPYPLDNLSLDANGDLWVAGLPDLGRTLLGFNDPLGPTAPSTVFRVHKKAEGDYEVTKVLEDSEGEVLPAATTVVHDVKTGRIFLSGVVSPFIAVCEPREIPASPQSRPSDGHSEL